MELEWFLVYGLLSEITSSHPGNFSSGARACPLAPVELFGLAAIAIIVSFSCIETNKNKFPNQSNPLGIPVLHFRLGDP